MGLWAGVVESDGERLARPSDLVDPWMIAEFAGVKQTTVTTWSHRHPDFPAPFVRLGKERKRGVWIRREVEAWLIQYGVVTKGDRWPDDVERDDLLTATEVADLVGWKSSGTPGLLVKRGNFPPPREQFGRTKLWSRLDVDEWLRTAPRKGSANKNP